MDNGSVKTLQPTGVDGADAAARLAEAQAQIDELVELNKRLRAELSDMTLMWVGAMDKSRNPFMPVRKAVAALRQAFMRRTPAPAAPVTRFVRDYQMLGALSALQQGRYTGLVIPTVELLALGYAVEKDGAVWISPEGEQVLRRLRGALLNTGQHPVVLSD